MTGLWHPQKSLRKNLSDLSPPKLVIVLIYQGQARYFRLLFVGEKASRSVSSFSSIHSFPSAWPNQKFLNWRHEGTVDCEACFFEECFKPAAIAYYLQIPGWHSYRLGGGKAHDLLHIKTSYLILTFSRHECRSIDC